ncbi:MAG: hypothetical protein RBT60_09510 [Candidatus Krumholzibacteria bacterium]|jgi:hypothetical protein|nr:hypothetical protein [Candidatus Krumholzibacteria bacterium]
MKYHAYFHRAYRRMSRLSRGHVALMVLFVLVLEILLVLFYRPLIDRYIGAVGRLAAACGVPTSVLHYPFLPVLVEDFPILESGFVFPDTRLALMNFLVGVLVILIVPHVRRLWKPLRIYVVYLALLNSASAAFFLLWPGRFPYNMAEFSQLYMGTQLGIWFMIPLVMGLVLLPVPSSVGEKLLVMLATGAWALLFGVLRYASFLYIFDTGSVIYMAAMFFALGPFLDFVYMVAIYSIYLNLVALRVHGAEDTWRWSF